VIDEGLDEDFMGVIEVAIEDVGFRWSPARQLRRQCAIICANEAQRL
jgi:hypothetical protein